MKERKNRFGWREALTLIAALALLILGGFGVKRLLDRNAGLAAGDATADSHEEAETVVMGSEPTDYEAENAAWEAAVPAPSRVEIDRLLSVFAGDYWYSLEKYDAEVKREYILNLAASCLSWSDPDAFSVVEAGGTRYMVLGLDRVNSFLSDLLGQTITTYGFVSGDEFLKTGETVEWCYTCDDRFYFPIHDEEAYAGMAQDSRTCFGVFTCLSGYAEDGAAVFEGGFQTYEALQATPQEYEAFLAMTPAEAERLVASGRLLRQEDGWFRMLRRADGSLQMLRYQLFDLPDSDEDLTDPEALPPFELPALQYRERTADFTNAMTDAQTPLLLAPVADAPETGVLYQAQPLTLRRAATVRSADSGAETDWCLVSTAGGDLGWIPAARCVPYDESAFSYQNAFCSVREGATYSPSYMPTSTWYMHTDDADNLVLVHGIEAETGLACFGPDILEPDRIDPAQLVPYLYAIPRWKLENFDLGSADPDPEPAEPVTTEPGPAAAETTEPEATEDAEARAEREALTEAMRELFSDCQDWYGRALNSRFASPDRVDLFRYFYDGIPGVMGYDSENQQREVEAAHPGLADPHTCLDRLPVTEMDQVLRQYFGIGLEQTGKRHLDWYYYVPENDSYYHEHGDAAVRLTTVLDAKALPDGRILCTYRYDEWSPGAELIPVWTVTLAPSEDGYRVVSNLPGEFVTAEDAGALLPLISADTAWRLDAAPGGEGPAVRELRLGEDGSLSYRAGDRDSEFSTFYGNVWYLEGDGTLCCELLEREENGSRIGAIFTARYGCALENGALVLTQLSEEGFGSDAAGTVLRFLPIAE